MDLYQIVNYLLSFLGVVRSPESPTLYNSRCSMLLAEGSAKCKDAEKGLSCDIRCGFGSENVHSCLKNQGWQEKLPNCFINPKVIPECSLTVGNGYVDCSIVHTKVGENLSCKISCGKSSDTYSCSIGQGWDKELPHCVAEIKDKPRCSLTVNSGAAICEDEGVGKIACNVFCDGQPHGFYHCSHHHGWDDVLPHCISSDAVGSRCNLMVKDGAVACQEAENGETTCNIVCDGKYKGSYRCSEDQGWDKSLPRCVSDLKVIDPCSGLILRNAFVECLEAEIGEVSCNISCREGMLGEYRCSKQKGWDKPLPQCVADVEVVASQCALMVNDGKAACLQIENGEFKCEFLCDSEYYESYRCSEDKGWDKTLPTCVSERKETKRTVCNPTRCSTDCGYLQLGGKCIDGACKCGYKGPVTPI